MATKPGTGLKIWTVVLSLAFAVLLFPNIVGRSGVWMSVFYTGLGVGLIWLLYYAIGRLIDRAVSEELKRRSRKEHDGESNEEKK